MAKYWGRQVHLVSVKNPVLEKWNYELKPAILSIRKTLSSAEIDSLSSVQILDDSVFRLALMLLENKSWIKLFPTKKQKNNELIGKRIGLVSSGLATNEEG